LLVLNFSAGFSGVESPDLRASKKTPAGKIRENFFKAEMKENGGRFMLDFDMFQANIKSIRE